MTRTTVGINVRYNKQEGDTIKQELLSLFREAKPFQEFKERHLKGAVTSTMKMKTRNDTIQQLERDLDSLILSDPRMYQGIQRIYRAHQVEIPSQKTIDKAEVVQAKKILLNEVINSKK